MPSCTIMQRLRDLNGGKAEASPHRGRLAVPYTAAFFDGKGFKVTLLNGSSGDPGVRPTVGLHLMECTDGSTRGQITMKNIQNSTCAQTLGCRCAEGFFFFFFKHPVFSRLSLIADCGPGLPKLAHLITFCDVFRFAYNPGKVSYLSHEVIVSPASSIWVEGHS